MKGYLYIISALSFFFGIALILYTDALRNRLRGVAAMGKTADRIMAGFTLAIGITLSFAAVDSLNFEFVLGISGIIALSGIVFLINPKNIFENIKKWFAETGSLKALRFCGVLMVIIGEAIWFLT